MVGDNKILTVSYGTFSCTLEGFEDPFSTMKAIAEYFRDLAAGDRFFGAEPPQPDADMLHRIAEQTIQSRVNAEVQDNGLILRQAEADEQQDAPAPAPEATPAPVAEPVAERVETPVVAEDVPVGTNTVAEKLKRIRAVVAAEAAQTTAFVEDDYAEDEVTLPQVSEPMDIGLVSEDAAPVAEETVEEETAPEAPVEDAAEDDTPEATFEAEEETTAEDDVAEAEETPEIESEDSVMADADTEDHADEAAVEELDEDLAEDLDQDPVEAASEDDQEDDQTGAVAEPEDAAALEDEDENETETAANDFDLSSFLASDTTDEDDADAVSDTAEEPDMEKEETAEDVAEPFSVASEDEEEAAEGTDAFAEDMTDAEPAEMSDEIAEEEAADLDEEDLRAGDIEDDDEDEDTAPRRRIVVQKISREDLRQSQDENDPYFSEDESDLSDEDEEDLMRALDAAATTHTVDADASDSADEDASDSAEEDAFDAEGAIAGVVAEDTDTDDEDDEDHAAARAARIARRSIETEDDESALERLMSVTSSRLENDESSVRRASIAHLKAAVAATKADKTLAEEAAADEEEQMDQYREDLARVVKPGRARPSTSGRASRPSPLVLVSEQRIDEPETDSPAIAASADVRPRRVTSGNLALQDEIDEDFDANGDAESDVQSFAEYAAEHSALELPDMLEAAAAHYTYLENTEEFTRPMLMRKIASITGPSAVSREDGLRAFGTLLRKAVIVKSGSGKFVLAKTSRFTPEAQTADS